MQLLLVIILSAITGAIAGLIAGCVAAKAIVQPIQTKEMYNLRELALNRSKIISVMNRWLMIKQRGKSVETYFIRKDINTIAIYGMGDVGQRLYDELKKTDIKVEYAIDQNANKFFDGELNVFFPDEPLPEVDAIVVTAMHYYTEIKERLAERIKIEIISIEEIINKA